MRECIFCRIVAGDAPASYVYEDEQLVAFMDTRPVNQGHTLVVPRAHAERIANLDTSTGGHLFAVAMSLNQAVQRAVGSDGINLQLADGEAAGQGRYPTSTYTSYRASGATGSDSASGGGVPPGPAARSWTSWRRSSKRPLRKLALHRSSCVHSGQPLRLRNAVASVADAP